MKLLHTVLILALASASVAHAGPLGITDFTPVKAPEPVEWSKFEDLPPVKGLTPNTYFIIKPPAWDFDFQDLPEVLEHPILTPCSTCPPGQGDPTEPIPEPATILLLGSGLALFGYHRKRRAS